MGLDLGRAPAEASLQRIRQRIKEQAGIENSIIAGSHTHHGPVLELTDQEGKGKGRFDAALRYYGADGRRHRGGHCGGQLAAGAGAHGGGIGAA